MAYFCSRQCFLLGVDGLKELGSPAVLRSTLQAQQLSHLENMNSERWLQRAPVRRGASQPQPGVDRMYPNNPRTMKGSSSDKQTWMAEREILLGRAASTIPWDPTVCWVTTFHGKGSNQPHLDHKKEGTPCLAATHFWKHLSGSVSILGDPFRLLLKESQRDTNHLQQFP